MVARLPTPDAFVDGLFLLAGPRAAHPGAARARALRPGLRALLLGRAVRRGRARHAEDPRLRRHGFAEVAGVRALQAVPAVGGLLARGQEARARGAAPRTPFDLCTATTRAEWETLEAYGTGMPTDWFPNGVDASTSRRPRRTTTRTRIASSAAWTTTRTRSACSISARTSPSPQAPSFGRGPSLSPPPPLRR